MFARSLVVPIIAAFVVTTGCGGGTAPRAASPSSSSPTAIPLPSIAPPSCPPASTSIDLAAKGIRFNKECLVVTADTPFTITLVNGDAGVPHNVAILTQSLSETFFKGKLITGVTTVTYKVPALKTGTYLYHCSVHPNKMNGTLTVD